MAEIETAPTAAPVTEEAFLADRLSFWSFFTGMTTKTTVALIAFCAWLWWCGVGGFSLPHVIVLPIAVAGIFYFL